MGVMILSSGLAMILIAIGLLSCTESKAAPPSDKAPAKGDAKTPEDVVKNPGTPLEKDAGKAAVLKRLKKLAESAPPKKLQPGAMCYEMAAPPDRAEYVCPKCNEKTLHVRKKGEFGGAPEFISWHLASCRRLVKQIKGLKVSLDEASFCKKCQPNAKKHELALVITYDDPKNPHRVSPVSLNDLKLLIEFTNGKNTHKDDYDFESPLKKHLKRLEQLLGVSLEKTK